MDQVQKEYTRTIYRKSTHRLGVDKVQMAQVKVKVGTFQQNKGRNEPCGEQMEDANAGTDTVHKSKPRFKNGYWVEAQHTHVVY